MELSKTFDPKGMDQRWYDRWMEHKLFESKPDVPAEASAKASEREPYTIVIPPPNVTGVLHVGHALNNSIQDILIRRARMQGKNACWVPGTDHASIATEAKVVQMLRERGIKKSDLTREEFLNYAWEWKEKYGSIILEQLKKLGCSCDWSRTAFTMDPDYYQSVIRVFIDLHKKGYIYRGLRMIHWDPKAKTSLSDEEVIKKEVKSKLYYLRYALEKSEVGSNVTLSTSSSLSINSVEGRKSEDVSLESETHITDPDFIVIATVRPETILGDSAIAVNPKDPRYENLVGRFALVPLINRRIPIIADEYVDIEFGTGALKVTPAHDMNDYQLGLKHNLEVIDVLNEDGTMSEAAQLYVGQDRFECRKNIVKDLEAQGHLVKIEDYTNQIGFSERTEAVVEPRLSLQWWCNMKEMAKPALEAVQNEEIKFYPKKFVNLYSHWMEGIRDWCISRQLWWGHRIPAWYDEQGDFVVAESEEEAIRLFQIRNPQSEIRNLKQDDDVLDTWFSSWLWPFEVFKGFSDPGNEDVKYYYPTNTLVTAPEIIFFWVARMIMAGFEYMKEKPFDQVYFTGIVRDKQGKKMSKQFGNSPDLLELIEKYGADAVRFGILISSPAGNDLLFDEKLIEQGRNFNNKIWNALRLVKMWELNIESNSQVQAGNEFAIEWFESKLNSSIAEIEKLFAEFQISAALKLLYSLVWDDFCSWYLEMVKPVFGEASDEETYLRTISFFERLMKLLHPFMPFFTEEVYQLLEKRGDHDFIATSKYPVANADKLVQATNEIFIKKGNTVKELISSIRDLRNKNQIKPKERLKLFGTADLASGTEIIIKLGGLSAFEKTASEIENAISFLVGADKFFLEATNHINPAEEKLRLKQELEYQKGFLESVMKKLSNEKFISKASSGVISNEQKKADDAKEKIRLIEEQLKSSGRASE